MKMYLNYKRLWLRIRIERDKKSLGYSVQDVKGSDLTVARESNVINSLQGRVAGVQIYKGGTGPGGSSRIVIRGSNSLRGADARFLLWMVFPLIIIIRRTVKASMGHLTKARESTDQTLMILKPMTVLKGPEAGALYGNRGANGVILITTKKGSSKKDLALITQSNLTFESPLLLLNCKINTGKGPTEF